jgi:large subunit ribosomal protein L25
VCSSVLLHVDFLRLRPGSRLKVNVPVHFINQDTCPGIKKGGALNIVLHNVELRVPADQIPDSLKADLSTLDIAEALHISAVTMPEGCKPTQAGDFTIASITPPAKAEETPAAAAPAAKK